MEELQPDQRQAYETELAGRDVLGTFNLWPMLHAVEMVFLPLLHDPSP
jgi:hypothetical protein